MIYRILEPNLFITQRNQNWNLLEQKSSKPGPQLKYAPRWHLLCRGSAVLCLVTRSCLAVSESMDCSPPGSSVHGNSSGQNTGVGGHALLQGICPTQGSNPGLPHCRWILYLLSRQGSPCCGRNIHKREERDCLQELLREEIGWYFEEQLLEFLLKCSRRAYSGFTLGGAQ